MIFYNPLCVQMNPEGVSSPILLPSRGNASAAVHFSESEPALGAGMDWYV